MTARPRLTAGEIPEATIQALQADERALVGILDGGAALTEGEVQVALASLLAVRNELQTRKAAAAADNTRERRSLLRRTERRLEVAESHERGAGLAFAEAFEWVDADLVDLGTEAARLNEEALLAMGRLLDAVRQRRRDAERAVRRRDDALAEAEALLAGETGQDLAEYALLLGLIALVAVVFLVQVGGQVAGVFEDITKALGGIPTGGSPAG